MTNLQAMLYFLPAQLLNLWAIWHAYTHRFETPVERVLWMCAGVFIPLLGGLAYVFWGMRRTKGKA